MKEKEYEILREGFFNCYKAFIDFVRINHNDNNIYSILVLRKPTNNNLIKVNIMIKNCYFQEGAHELYNNVILNKEQADLLINDIRNDFRDNHTILYSMVNPKTLIQTLQNTNFSLNIKLNSNSSELDEALNFNRKINQNPKRYRALTKN